MGVRRTKVAAFVSGRSTRAWARFGFVAVSVAITLAALFVDGFPPASWKTWLGISDRKPVVTALVPQRSVPGQVTVTMPKPRGNDSSLSPKPIPLILVSTHVGRNSREGFAQLGVDPTSPQTYAAGAVLANGARLSEIYANFVVLEREGQSVRLYLQGQGVQVEATGVSSLATVGGIRPSPVVIAGNVSLTDFIRPSPVFNGGLLTGFQVYPGDNVAAFESLGLKAGDVIVSINGAPIVAADETLSQLESLIKGSALIVGVRRAGTVRSVSLDGSVLVQAAQRHGSPPELPAERANSI